MRDKLDGPSGARSAWRRIGLRVLIGAGVLAAAAVIIGLVLGGFGRGGSGEEDSEPGEVIVVSNQITKGSDRMVEDSSAAYLSRRPLAACPDLGCRVEGAQLISGDKARAICQLDGAPMTNGHAGDASDDANPGLVVGATRWYRVEAREEVGFLSEVHVAPEFRGGLGLPRCVEREIP